MCEGNTWENNYRNRRNVLLCIILVNNISPGDSMKGCFDYCVGV
jgi:hypothetical protein